MIHHVKKAIHKPHLIIPITLVAAILIGLFVFFKVAENRHAMAPEIQTTLTDQSTIISGGDISLAFPKSGRVDSVPVKVGDTVVKGQVLASLDSQDASGALSQAKGILLQAQANYNRVVNGATGPDINVAKQAVKTAEVNLANTTTQQQTNVSNAYHALLSNNLQAMPDDVTTLASAPTITGDYTGSEGSYEIHMYPAVSQSGEAFYVSGLESGFAEQAASYPVPLGTKGLYIQFPNGSLSLYGNTMWTVSIPNTKSASYTGDENAYQSALQTQKQSVDAAQATLDQANANLTLKQSAARPEDVAQAQAQVESATGAVEQAQGAYANNFIYAPADGTITVVNVHSGEIAVMNGKAIGMTTLPTNTNQ